MYPVQCTLFYCTQTQRSVVSDVVVQCTLFYYTQTQRSVVSDVVVQCTLVRLFIGIRIVVIPGAYAVHSRLLPVINPVLRNLY